MGKRKIFKKTETLAHSSLTSTKRMYACSSSETPSNYIVNFPKNAGNTRTFDFSRWYGVGIDQITYECQHQIERYLSGQDETLEICTIANFCVSGLRHFLTSCSLHASTLGRSLDCSDINRVLIDTFLIHLGSLGVTDTTQRSNYNKTKTVLTHLARRNQFELIRSGDDATFPTNPFPNNNRMSKGESELSKSEKKALAVALRDALKPIWTAQHPLSYVMLSYALLAIALHTGRNTTPLLEMSRDCLRPHPKDDTCFLVLWKRRGFKLSSVKLRAMSKPEQMTGTEPTINHSIEKLIRKILLLTEPLILEAPIELKNRVWLVRSEGGFNKNNVITLSSAALIRATKKLVADYKLTNNMGEPLRINISRLRKSFGNRVFKLSSDNLAITAAALGNTLQVTDRHYLPANEESRRDWKFMGELLVNELLSNTIGATYKETPTGRCRDPENGQYAPKNQPGATCMNFLNCLRCKHYAVTSEDLHKLFSFYYRILGERSRMDKKRWTKLYAHIPRLIDNYIVTEGLRRGIFKNSAIDAARAKARTAPHPFWSVDVLESFEVFT